MAQVQTATVEAEAPIEVSEAETSIIKVWVAKANAYLDLDLSPDKLPKEVYLEILHQGAQKVLGRGMSKIATKGLEGDELEEAHKAAYEVAQVNLEAMYSGEIRLTTVKRTKEKKGKIKTRAMQKARLIVKAQIKAEGDKVSNYTAKQISEAAEELLQLQPEIVQEAKEELAREDAQLATATKKGIKITAAKGGKLKADPKRVKAVAERAAKAKVAAKSRKEARAQA